MLKTAKPTFAANLWNLMNESARQAFLTTMTNAVSNYASVDAQGMTEINNTAISFAEAFADCVVPSYKNPATSANDLANLIEGFIKSSDILATVPMQTLVVNPMTMTVSGTINPQEIQIT